jgi:hypothetical protein
MRASLSNTFLETTAKTLATSPPYHRRVPLVWTAEARKQLISRTPIENEDPKRPHVGAAWGSVRQALSYDQNVTQTFVSGRPNAKAQFRTWMEQCETLARAPSMPRFEDADVAAVFALLVGRIVRHSLVTTIYAKQGGMSFAFDVGLRMLAMEVNPRPMYVMARTTPAQPEASWREILREQRADARERCKDVARTIWPSASLAQKTTIAYALFEETAWAAEVCRAWLAVGDWPATLLYAIVPEIDVANELVRKRTQSRGVIELVETFGDAILPALVEIAQAPKDDDARYAAEALALFDDPKAAAALAPLVKWAAARPFVQAYFTRHPSYADALAPVAANKNRAAAVAQEVLDGAKRALEGGALTEASLDELPAIFREPPWRSAKRPRRPSVSIEVAPIARPLAVAWKPGERERALAIAQHYDARQNATKGAIAAHARALERGRHAGFFVHKNQRLPDSSTLASWNAGSRPYDTPPEDRLHYALAKFEDRAIDGLEKFVRDLDGERTGFSLLFRVATPRIAPAMASLRAHKTFGKLARGWLHRHGEIAALGLIPAALAGDDDCEQALVRLASTGVDVVGIGAAFGDEAKSALEDLLTWDAVYDLPSRIPKLGPTWKPETFTRPTTLGGKVLPLEAMNLLGTMLAFSPIDPPYAGIGIVKSICTARSLAEFSWDAARTWEHAGHKLREKWMLASLAHFADAEIVRRMTPGIREDFAIEVLEHMNSDVALMELLTILGRATKSGDKTTIARIESILDEAAAVRGLETDELEEELAPAKAVEADGTVSLDFGPRKLRVGFDEQLEPYVKDERGGRVRALPPPRAGDDPELAERAKALWRDLKEDVAILAARRIAGLKRAMTRGRQWTAERFRRVWIDNGLMKHIARGVVWTDGTTAFRVAEDGSLTTSNDALFVLAPTKAVAVLHPLRAAKDEIDRWRTLFVDYEILQPFPQLERVPFPKPAADRSALPFPTGDVHELFARATERGFTRRWSRGTGQLHRELTRGALTIEFEKDGAMVLLEGNPDIVEVADALDDLQSMVPSTRR